MTICDVYYTSLKNFVLVERKKIAFFVDITSTYYDHDGRMLINLCI